MTFRQAVEATPSINGHYRAGLQALRDADARRIQCADTRRLTGSVNVDEALKDTEPSAPRWDYGIGYRRGNKEVALWVEVHPASSSNIEVMLNKLRWVRNWLSTQAHKMAELTQGDYYWVSTDATIAITPNSPQTKRLAAAGLRGPMRMLQLQ